MIESLTDKLTRGIITDDHFKSNIKRYEKKRTQLKKVRQKYDDRKDDWLEKIEHSFNYAKNARSQFAKGDKNTKKELFVTLGSNFFLEDKKLTVDLHKPFQYMRNSNEEVSKLLPSLEPLENSLDNMKKADLERLISVWSTWRESNPRHQLGRLG